MYVIRHKEQNDPLQQVKTTGKNYILENDRKRGRTLLFRKTKKWGNRNERIWKFWKFQKENLATNNHTTDNAQEIQNVQGNKILIKKTGENITVTLEPPNSEVILFFLTNIHWVPTVGQAYARHFLIADALESP